jgi:hypothetical protein
MAAGIGFDVASATPLRELADADLGPSSLLGGRPAIPDPALRAPIAPALATRDLAALAPTALALTAPALVAWANPSAPVFGVPARVPATV